MENPIAITLLNDFIFCPASIYFHNLDAETNLLSYQNEAQINGTDSHKKTDEHKYSDKTSILQAIFVYCEKYNLYGKIDVFDTSSGILTERKKKIARVYEGYIFQLYAQYFALTEMGYKVRSMRLYSMDDNKVYPVLLPADNIKMLQKFEALTANIQKFDFKYFKQQNSEKCKRCIYEPLCSFSRIKEDF